MHERNSDTRIAIVGGGVAGLSAAHELSKFFDYVEVFEASGSVGGKAVSQDVGGYFTDYEGKDEGKPLWLGEHGFRLFPHTYLHITETMREIEADKRYRTRGRHVEGVLVPSTEGGYAFQGRVNTVTRPFPSTAMEFYQSLRRALGDSPFGNDSDIAMFAWHLLKYVTSCPERRQEEYDNLSWLEYVGATEGHYSDQFDMLLRAVPRGLNAMKADVGSARSFGNMMLRFAFDFEGGRGDRMEQVLGGPTQESWLEPWKSSLTNPMDDGRGVVEFRHGCSLRGFDFGDDGTERNTVRRLCFEVDWKLMAESFGEDEQVRQSQEVERSLDLSSEVEDWLRAGMVPDVAPEPSCVWTKAEAFQYYICAIPLEAMLSLIDYTNGRGSETERSSCSAVGQEEHAVRSGGGSLGTRMRRAYLQASRVRETDAERSGKDEPLASRNRKEWVDGIEKVRAGLESMTSPMPQGLDDELRMVHSALRMTEFDASLDRLTRIRRDHTAPMVGLQFFLKEDLPIVNGHVFYPGSPWALTSVSQAQFWRRSSWPRTVEKEEIPEVCLFDARRDEAELEGVLSVIISEWQGVSPRRAHVVIDGRMMQLSRPISPFAPNGSAVRGEEGVDSVSAIAVKREVWFQLKDALNEPGRPPRLTESMLIAYESSCGGEDELQWLDELLTNSCHIDDDAVCLPGEPDADSKAVNDRGFVRKIHKTPLFIHPRESFSVRPDAQLRIPNLLLASDYVRTLTDLATMEAANEAARRAVLAILWREGVGDPEEYPRLYPPVEPRWAVAAQAIDRMLLRAGQSHPLDAPGMLASLMKGALSSAFDLGRQLLGGSFGRPAPTPRGTIGPRLLAQTEQALISLVGRDGMP